MGIKSRRITPDQNKNFLGSILVKNDDFVDGTASTYITKGQVLSIVGTSSSGAYLHVTKADTGTDETDLLVAMEDIRDTGRATDWYIFPLDTSGASAKDPIYLDDATAGLVVLTKPTASAKRIGKALNSATVANGGLVLIDVRSGGGTPEPPTAASAYNVETLAGAKTLVTTDAKYQKLDPDGSNRTVTLPAEADSVGLVFVVSNSGAPTEELNVENDAAGSIVDIDGLEQTTLVCDGTTWIHMGLIDFIAS
jgi:hypothetical protein